MRQIVLIAILASMSLVAHAQNAGEPHRIVFQSDRSGNIVKRIPIYKENEAETRQEHLCHLFFTHRTNEVKVLLYTQDKDKECVLRIYSAGGETAATYAIESEESVIHLSTLPHGVYVLSLEVAGRITESQKVYIM